MTSNHFADRLCQAVAERGTPTCVGLDPVYEHLPVAIREQFGGRGGQDSGAAAEAIVEFGRGVIDAVAGLVPVMKINIAFFEVYGGRGVDAYFELVQAARVAGLLVIGDVKRADIGHTTAAYARGQLSEGGAVGERQEQVTSTGAGEKTAGANAGQLPLGDRLLMWDRLSSRSEDRLENLSHSSSAGGDSGRYAVRPDAVTVNPYLGQDGVGPFLEVCRAEGKGVFVLVQTSNEAAREVQDVRLETGDTLAVHVGRLVNRWAGGPGLVGACGYSAVGVVVSPRDVAGADTLRSILQRSIFLVPGYGAQGQSAEQVAHCFKEDGTGAIVNSSRGVVYAYEHDRYAALRSAGWQQCVEAACRSFIEDINGVLARRRRT